MVFKIIGEVIDLVFIFYLMFYQFYVALWKEMYVIDKIGMITLCAVAGLAFSDYKVRNYKERKLKKEWPYNED